MVVTTSTSSLFTLIAFALISFCGLGQAVVHSFYSEYIALVPLKQKRSGVLFLRKVSQERGPRIDCKCHCKKERRLWLHYKFMHLAVKSRAVRVEKCQCVSKNVSLEHRSNQKGDTVYQKHSWQLTLSLACPSLSSFLR